MDKIINYVMNNGTTIINALILIILGYIFIKLILKFLKKILCRSKIEYTVITFILSVIKVVLYLLLVMIVFSTFGINMNSIVTAFGVAALTTGLALQDSLKNLASGVVILLNKPFVAGDILEFEGLKGSVQSIKIFSTTIHTLDNKLVTIPNSRLTSNNVINCTMADNRRINLSYLVSYEDDIDEVRKVILDVISKNDKVLKDPSASVYVGEHKDSGLEIVVWIWVNTDDYYDVYFYMQENVKKAFDKNNITIPYPQIVLRNS